MRIRSLLITVIALAFGVIATRLLVLEIRTQQRQQLDAVQLEVERVSRDGASLLVLSQEYMLRQSPRAARQWRVVQAELARILPPVGNSDVGLHSEVATVAEVVSGLPELFSAIESTAKEGDTEDVRVRRDTLADHLVSETRRISDAAFEMSEKLSRLRRDRDVVERRVTQATMAAFGLLTLVLATLVLRRVLRPMVGLETAAQAMRGGDLSARSGWQMPDEFGRLSHAFDTMAQSLQERETALRESNVRLRSSEGELTAARRDLQSILDAVPSMIGYWDKGLKNRFANHAYHHWFGRDPGALPGTDLRDLLGRNLYEQNAPHIEAALRGEPQSFERAIPRPDGSGSRHALTHYVPDRAGDEVRGFYVLAHDISDLTESRLTVATVQRENEALLSTIRAQSIFSVADRAGLIIEVNDNFSRISGYSREELLGQNHRIINSGVQDAAFWTSMWRSISQGRPWRGEICNRAKDGSLYWVDSIIAPLLGADGRAEKYVSIRTDITAAKLAEQKLRESEAFLDRVGQVSGVGGWEVDLRSQTVTWSDQTYRIHEADFSYQPSLEDGLSFYKPEGRPVIERAVQEGIAAGTGWDLELPLVTARGRAIWVRTLGVVEFESGKAVKLIGAFQDITQRKLSDELLQQAYERFEIAADSANIGVWEYDPVASSLVWDERMYRLYHRQRSGPAEEPYTLWSDSLHPADLPEAEACLAAALRGECNFDPEFRVRWPNGEWRHLKASARVIRDADGNAVRMTGVNIDITERKRAELDLQETSSLLKSVLDAASEVSIIATDPQFTITVFNAGAEKMLGYSPQEMIGRSSSMLRQGDVDESSPGAGWELVSEIEGLPEDAATLHRAHNRTYLRKDGSSVPVSLVTTAMRGASGELLGYLGVAQDVTRQKQYEASLREAMVKAEQASRAKSEFLANMSHEIRTPMNAVIGLAYLLRRTPLDAEQSEFLSRIDQASKALLAVINDVLDLSKIEAGEMSIERAAFGPAALLKDLADVMSVHSDAKGIDLSIVMPDDLPDALEGDAARLRQVLTNLLSNAIKFTASGQVTLHVLPQAAPVGRVGLRFEVQDTGIGISPEEGTRIFSPFAQADTSTTRRFGGTGLGLSIVKQLVQLMGGEVGFDSVPGEGSRFWFDVEFGAASIDALQQQQATYADPGRGLAGVHVLVVDDSDINLAVARRILEIEGAKVAVASNGQLACDLVQVQAFDLVLMDVQMPVMDGYEATRRMRRMRLPRLPIIALTAGALSSERQRATAAGMDDFISKPFHVKSLVRTIRSHLRMAAGMRHREVSTSAAAMEPVSAAWPDIEGIDGDDVRGRLVGDLGLFRSTLKRLLNEFADLAMPDAAAGRAGLDALASRAHKLRGSAGILGARRLQTLAGAVEAACREGHAQQAAPLVQRLATQLQVLAGSASVFLSTPRTDLGGATAGTADLEPADVAELVDHLRNNSLSAIGLFKGLAGPLRGRLGSTAFECLAEHVDNLHFTEAVSLLEAALACEE